MINRRKLFMSAAPAIGLALAGCASINGGNTISTITSDVIGYIQQAVSAVAQYIPTASAIASLIASVYPGAEAAVTVGTAAINYIVSLLEGLVSKIPPAAQARLHARLAASSPNAPVVIGVIHGVTIYGYH